jgi:hypothetical protein
MERLMGHGSKFDIDLRRGEAAEEALVHVFLRSRVEVKADEQAMFTGNVFVEVEQPDRETGRKPSGIAITRADWWAFEIVGADRWFIVKTEHLKNLVERASAGRGFVMGGDKKLYKGVLIPLSWLIEMTDGSADVDERQRGLAWQP